MAKKDEGTPDIFLNSFEASKGFEMIKHWKTKMQKKTVKHWQKKKYETKYFKIIDGVWWKEQIKKIMIIVGKEIEKTLQAKVPEVKKVGMVSKTR